LWKIQKMEYGSFMFALIGFRLNFYQRGSRFPPSEPSIPFSPIPSSLSFIPIGSFHLTPPLLFCLHILQGHFPFHHIALLFFHPNPSNKIKVVHYKGQILFNSFRFRLRSAEIRAPRTNHRPQFSWGGQDVLSPPKAINSRLAHKRIIIIPSSSFPFLIFFCSCPTDRSSGQ